MGRVLLSCFSVSLDGFGAGADQDIDNPLGKHGMDLHQWMFPTRAFQQMHGSGTGTTGVDNDFAQRGMDNVGAWILGRNMFGPFRGPWRDETWQGWWGDEPPYRVPVFVLTRHARAPIAMRGGTTFQFVTEGAERALELAREAAGDKDVRVGGGVATVRHYLQQRQLDQLHLAFAPVLLGQGEHLLQGIDTRALGYQVTEHIATDAATHVVLTRRGGG